jgi:hypothetical protein
MDPTAGDLQRKGRSAGRPAEQRVFHDRPMPLHERSATPTDVLLLPITGFADPAFQRPLRLYGVW